MEEKTAVIISNNTNIKRASNLLSTKDWGYAVTSRNKLSEYYSLELHLQRSTVILDFNCLLSKDKEDVAKEIFKIKKRNQGREVIGVGISKLEIKDILDLGLDGYFYTEGKNIIGERVGYYISQELDKVEDWKNSLGVNIEQYRRIVRTQKRKLLIEEGPKMAGTLKRVWPANIKYIKGSSNGKKTEPITKNLEVVLKELQLNQRSDEALVYDALKPLQKLEIIPEKLGESRKEAILAIETVGEIGDFAKNRLEDKLDELDDFGKLEQTFKEVSIMSAHSFYDGTIQLLNLAKDYIKESNQIKKVQSWKDLFFILKDKGSLPLNNKEVPLQIIDHKYINYKFDYYIKNILEDLYQEEPGEASKTFQELQNLILQTQGQYFNWARAENGGGYVHYDLTTLNIIKRKDNEGNFNYKFIDIPRFGIGNIINYFAPHSSPSIVRRKDRNNILTNSLNSFVAKLKELEENEFLKSEMIKIPEKREILDNFSFFGMYFSLKHLSTVTKGKPLYKNTIEEDFGYGIETLSTLISDIQKTHINTAIIGVADFLKEKIIDKFYRDWVE